MKIVVDNLTSTLETDNPKIISTLREKYSFSVPGHEYSQAYKKRRWDGKKRYFGANGKFKTGLLPRIVADLKEIPISTGRISPKTLNLLSLKLQSSSIGNIKKKPYTNALKVRGQ